MFLPSLIALATFAFVTVTWLPYAVSITKGGCGIISFRISSLHPTYFPGASSLCATRIILLSQESCGGSCSYFNILFT